MLIFYCYANKESVYFEWIPSDKPPDYYLRLDEAVNTNGIETINTLHIYNQQ